MLYPSFYFYLWFTFNLGRKSILASGTLWPRDINRGGKHQIHQIATASSSSILDPILYRNVFLKNQHEISYVCLYLKIVE